MKNKKRYLFKVVYELDFSNKSGLVSPIIIEFTFKDSTKCIDRIPADIWLKNEKNVLNFYVMDKEIATINWMPIAKPVIFIIAKLFFQASCSS
jgi:hypothetical protein